MKAIIKSLAVTLLVHFTQVAFAQNTIDSCGTEITSSGTYLVTQNLINTSGFCIKITGVTNVTLDCQGYRLTGTGSGSGIWADDTTTGIVIRNCDVYSFQYGIHYRGDHGVVEYNRLVDNFHGIRLSQAYGDDVRWNTGNDNVYGMYIDLSYNANYIYENTFHRSEYGIYCHRGARNYFIANQLNLNNVNGLKFYTTCHHNFVWHNTANLNATGLYIQTDPRQADSGRNDFYKNVFNRNSARGIHDQFPVGFDTNNTYEGNVCRNNGTGPSYPSGLCK